jgi:hypothetical protein
MTSNEVYDPRCGIFVSCETSLFTVFERLYVFRRKAQPSINFKLKTFYDSIDHGIHQEWHSFDKIEGQKKIVTPIRILERSERLICFDSGQARFRIASIWRLIVNSDIRRGWRFIHAYPITEILVCHGAVGVYSDGGFWHDEHELSDSLGFA